MRAFTFAVAAVLLSNCAGAATTPIANPSSSALEPATRTSNAAFAIDGTLYTLSLEPVYPGIVGALQGYTGSKPKLLGTLDGPKSGLNSPYAIAAGRRGNLFVSNGFGDGSCETCTITEYAKDRYGDPSPLATILNVEHVNGLSVDRRNNVYAAGQSPTRDAGASAVYRYSRGAYQRTRELERRYLGEGIALDPTGRIYLSTNQNGYRRDGAVEVFGAGTHGSARPIGTITGSKTGMRLPSGLAFDGAGDLYVAEYDNASITVFAAGRIDGNIAPLRTIIGTDTKLKHPSSISFDRRGDIYVDDLGSPNEVLVFSPGANGDAVPLAAYPAPPLQYAPSGMVVVP